MTFDSLTFGPVHGILPPVKQDIRIYGDPVLREKAEPVAAVDDGLRRLAADMIETMRAAEGCGLAAQQVGRAVPLCVIEASPEQQNDAQGNCLNPGLAMPMALVNPVITASSKKTDSFEEGCLSFPDLRGSIERPVQITLRYLDLDGQAHETAVKGFVARIIQHEVDHLNGVLFIDRMSFAKKIAIKGRLERMKAETEDRLGLA